MVRRSRAAILPTNIILLQNLVKRDPQSYHEEFLQQYAHYESLRDIFMLNGMMNEAAGSGSGENGDNSSNSNSSSTTQLIELVGFVSQVCSCFPKETANFPNELKQLVLEHHKSLPFELKEKIITSLMMLKNKGVITSEQLIQTLFPLLIAYSAQGAALSVNSHARELRKLIYNALVSLLKSANTGSKNQKLNRSTQAVCFDLLEKPDSQGVWAARLTRELWRRGIWDDSRAVEIMTHSALHDDTKIAMSGVMFFLDADKEREENFEEEAEDDNDVDLDSLRHKMQVNKKSSRRGKKLENALKTVKKKNKSNDSNSAYLNFTGVQLLRDPQGFAEKLFTKHLSSKNSNRFDMEQKISLMQLLSRLIGTHKLMVLGIYTYFLKYLTPKQRDVTKIMAAAAQACHDLIPPETLEVLVRKIADEFVSDGVASEVAAAGLNTIREICTRAPLAIDETLLQDLVEYRGSKAKGVNMAAKSLVSLYREVAPEMLKRKFRGKTAAMELQESKRQGNDSAGNKKLQFGVDSSNVEGIAGLELLAKWKAEHGDGSDEEDDAAWEVEEDDDDEEVEGEWVKMDSDKEYDVSMSEDEEDEKTKEEKAEEAKSAVESAKELVTTRILTPADFVKLQQLRTEEGVAKLMGIQHHDELVDSDRLTGPVKYKQTREERLQHVKEGREGREKFGSRRGKLDGARSTTNKEKERRKNFVMTIHKRSVTGKQRMSLRDKQKVLKAHITKQKKKGH